MKLMLQRLLAERFKLVLHRETKEMPVLVLSVGKPATELRQSSDSRIAGSIGPGPDGSLKFTNSTMAEFSEVLSGPLHIPIIDRTASTVLTRRVLEIHNTEGIEPGGNFWLSCDIKEA
jgi:uncharacterized protein (TIGR03435 family)